jgi:16S rRNA (cytosine1402-N4)-methyltransferase
MKRRHRSTPPGQHRPVLLDEILAALEPQPGEVVVDCTLGWAGHAVELLRRVRPDGLLVGLDLDAENFPQARQQLEAVGGRFALQHGNFAALPSVLAAHQLRAVDAVVADLGMSSMQVDDPQRGFSYARGGPLDMRMDRSRGRTAAELLATISEVDLRNALREFGDEPQADRIAAAVVAARREAPLRQNDDLVRVIMAATGHDKKGWRLHPSRGRWNLHPAARTFQALRILVNRELANLEHLLRVLPDCLKPGGRAALISFHSGEDRLVKAAFKVGFQRGLYAQIADEPVRPTEAERAANPRARSAKLRWARRAAPNDLSK